jgi:glycosyltransferase involved in cell wall biosynthesis
MRIAWFTSVSRRSGIGEFSRHVTRALAAHAEVDIWTPDADPLDPSELRVIRFGGGREPGEALAGYDAIVYNIGDTLAPHGEIHATSKRHPGIVILHDRVLHHMFVAMWCKPDGVVGPSYVSRIAAYYGEEAARMALESVAWVRPPLWAQDDEVVRYPLDEEALQRALGAVTHSEAHARWLRSRWLGPVCALPNPTYRDVLVTGAAAGAAPPARADGRLQVTTIGHVNANKQSHRVVRMLAADPQLAARVRYSIVGPADPANPYVGELRALLASLPEVPVEMLDWLEEPELDRLMAATDVFVNLRHPVMEGGSASLMRELAFGRAVLCFDDGCYAEIPGDALARVPAGDFGAAHAELARLVSDGGRRRAVGAAARRVAGERGEAEYAAGLIEFIGQVQRTAPALTLLDRVADELGAMRADPGLAVYDMIARELAPVLDL